MLCMAPSGVDPDIVEKYLRLLHYFGAVFRLSFRHPDKMHFEDADRELIKEYLNGTFEATEEAVEKEELSSNHWQTDAEPLERLHESNRAQEHQEL
ncbi:hypothetical protein AAVH_42764 [Aphelenchoides avenae]|nr:hypothetical protein AAVH_42764 [Aphelenchus avenae]